MFLLVVCGIAWMADASEVMLLSFLMTAVGKPWNLGATEEATLGGIVFAGMLIGAYSWGVICDKMGRKIGIGAIFLFCSVFGLASAFCPSFWFLVAARFFVGIGVSCFSSCELT